MTEKKKTQRPIEHSDSDTMLASIYWIDYIHACLVKARDYITKFSNC